jgi:hypothetical protein
MASIDINKSLPNDDPNVTLTIRLIMQGKVRRICALAYMNCVLTLYMSNAKSGTLCATFLSIVVVSRHFLIPEWETFAGFLCSLCAALFRAPGF